MTPEFAVVGWAMGKYLHLVEFVDGVAEFLLEVADAVEVVRLEDFGRRKAA